MPIERQAPSGFFSSSSIVGTYVGTGAPLSVPVVDGTGDGIPTEFDVLAIIDPTTGHMFVAASNSAGVAVDVGTAAIPAAVTIVNEPASGPSQSHFDVLAGGVAALSVLGRTYFFAAW